MDKSASAATIPEPQSLDHNSNRSIATSLNPTGDWRIGGNDEAISRPDELVDSVFGKLPDVTIGTIGIVAAVCATIIGTLLIVLICVCQRRRRQLVAKATSKTGGSGVRQRTASRHRRSGLSSLVTGLPGSSSGSPWGDGDQDEADGEGFVDTTFVTTVSNSSCGDAAIEAGTGRSGALSPRLAEMQTGVSAGTSTFGQPLHRTATVGKAATASTSSAAVDLRRKQQQQQPPPQSRLSEAATSISESGNAACNASTRSKLMYEVVV